MLEGFWKYALGLKNEFLDQKGELNIEFHPHWPGQDYLDKLFNQQGWGPTLWNMALGVLGFLLVLYVYRREGRSRVARIVLGTLRALLIAFVIALLNRPMLVRNGEEKHPSVLAIMLDDSLSMRIRDMKPDGSKDEITREKAATDLLTANGNKLIKDLARSHVLHFYRFDSDAQPLGTPVNVPIADLSKPTPAEEKAIDDYAAEVAKVLAEVKPEGANTQIRSSMRTVVQRLQSQQFAGIVGLTDGRDVPDEPSADVLGTKVVGVAIGGNKELGNLSVDPLKSESAALKGDIVVVKTVLRSSGYPKGRVVRLTLGRLLGSPTTNPRIRTAAQTLKETFVSLSGSGEDKVEFQFKADEVGKMDLQVEAELQPGETNDEDNTASRQIDIVDTQVRVLFVEGYPRWEYRYLWSALARDKKTSSVACLLLSASPGYDQKATVQDEKGTKRSLKEFPVTLDSLAADWDVVIFGDVDPHQFSDKQLQMIKDFVDRKSGGFGMIAGPRSSPYAFRGSPIETILPVLLGREEPDQRPVNKPFLPVTRPSAESSSLMRLAEDPLVNRAYFTRRDKDQVIQGTLPPLWWYCRGITRGPTGIVLAEHPEDKTADGKEYAPLLVVGQFGGGRTLFSAMDETWRWRWYTGEGVFDSYWIQQVRYLARAKQLNKRALELLVDPVKCEVGSGRQINVTLRVYSGELLKLMGEQVPVDVTDEAGKKVRSDMLVRDRREPEVWKAAWDAGTVGRFTVSAPSLQVDRDQREQKYEVVAGSRELSPEAAKLDRGLLSNLAARNGGVLLDYTEAAEKLPKILPSAAEIQPIRKESWLWDAPLVLGIFVLLITAEWVLRKVYGML